ncbi:MAG: hypothetical protein JSS83_18495 [Cyanobacteria bacterium SZAS LIN-3]|nr:hypothetical protein [Cyanobacteria bacterium SZAS LIN-3]
MLAVGRWIESHRALPPAGAFAWTAGTLIDVRYLPYQWLSTLVFFALFKSAGAVGLLFLVSTVVFQAFVFLPLLLSRRLGTSLIAQGVRSVLAFSAASFHFPLRPELFSYLFISFLVSYLALVLIPGVREPAGAEGQDKQPGPNKPMVRYALHALAGFLFFAIWANLHSAFALGLLVVFLLTLVCGARIRSLAAFCAGSGLGTLCTPFSFALYSYLPELFFSPVNKYNQELLPLRPGELLSLDYLPYLILQIIFLIASIASLLKQKKSAPSASLICCAFVTAALFVSGDLCRRMIPFAVLFSFLYFQMTWLLVFGPSGSPAWLAPFERATQSVKYGATVLLVAFFAIVHGTEASALIFPLAIPQSTSGFQVPAKAVQFIKTSRPAGRLCNDAQFGDVLIFELDEKAQVFIDTRFDMYGAKFCLDYYTIANALPGWEKLLQDYKIDWIFFPRQAPLGHRLQKNAEWKMAYGDNEAIIMVRVRGER